ncbi:MAG: formate/nitrite transporter family protein [Halofilum sp. (in: g-proteobacteria)]
MPASKDAKTILDTVITDGRNELGRAKAGLGLSGLSAGLNISLGAVAMAMVGSMTGGIGPLAIAFYPIGFIIVVLGRAQLFTENTVTPVTVVLARHAAVAELLRFWFVVLAANLLGALIFAMAAVYVELLPPAAAELMFDDVSKKLGYGFALAAMKGIFGGWIVALMAWLVSAVQDTISQIFVVWMLAMMIPLLDLMHSIAGASEVLIAVFSGQATWFQYVFAFQIPTTIGNILGGVILVAILNYGQVVGSRSA